jgi:uncharacterized surface protein with fasciclin (FAS1) repeats
MKIISNFKKIIVLALFALTSFSCSKDDDATVLPPDNTITALAKGDPNLSILVQALTKAGLANTLSDNGPFTVFAPTNTAFAAFLQANNFATLNDVPVPLLKEILLNHVVNGTKRAADLTTGYIKTNAKGSASTTNMLSMFVNTASGVKLNGVSSVTTPNVTASNGVIHVVDAVIGLPTVVTHAAANPNFSSLVTTLTGAGQPTGANAFTTVLGGTGPFTVFAPTNPAFTAFNTELAATPPTEAQVTRVLQYHVVSGANVLAATLTNNQMVTPILAPAQMFTIQLPTTGPQIKDASNRISKIIATDVQCSNGVIHALDKVLLPVL